MTEEVLTDILKRVRVKSLLRFMCVSKRWCNLIADPFFVSSHLRFNQNSSSPDFPLVLMGRDIQELEYLLLNKTQKAITEQFKIQFPWNPNPKHISILGHCNGVFCARESQTSDVNDDSVGVTRLIICNPITRSFQTIPEIDNERPRIWDKKYEAVGFGFVDDVAYKVVGVIYDSWTIFHGRPRSRAYELPWAEVYDSRSVSWRRVLGEVDLLRYYGVSNGVYNPYDGCFYWIGSGFGKRNKYCTTFVSFNPVEEKWNKILLPKDYKLSASDDLHHEEDNYENEDDSSYEEMGYYGVYINIKIVGESVTMFVEDGCLWCERDTSIWKMNKEEDNVSWTLMHKLTMDGSVLGICGDGKHLLMKIVDKVEEKNKLVLHDSENTDDPYFDIADLEYRKTYTGFSNFVESLLLLNWENGINNAAKETIYIGRKA